MTENPQEKEREEGNPTNKLLSLGRRSSSENQERAETGLKKTRRHGLEGGGLTFKKAELPLAKKTPTF